MLSNNNVSGSIPSVLANSSSLAQLQLDTNQFSGLIPSELGFLKNLEVFFAWENQLEGSIPSSLANCGNLQSLDLSHNSLTGIIPPGLFQLRNLTKLLLISNDISGTIPEDIGNCTSLVRLRLGSNRITGQIPEGIGGLKGLNFLDLSGNGLSGPVPDEIGNCTELQMLILSGNSFTGTIPTSLGLCSSLQLLDLSSNEITGNIPVEICQIEALEIALNLSCNRLTGEIPTQISALNKLSILDLSHNQLEGDLSPLAELENLVSLNVSYNNFTGYLPNNKLFRQLPASDLAGNQGLCSFGLDSCFISGTGTVRNGNGVKRSRRIKLALALLITMTIAIVVMGTIAVIRARKTIGSDDDSEMGDLWPWKFTPFQKLNFSVDQVLKCLVDSNVIGKGCSGVVYRANMENGDVIAVKKLWPTTTMPETGGYNREERVYSYGVVVLEVLTGKQPIDPTIPEGLHVVDWVRQKKGAIEVLAPSLLCRPESEIEEMMQALGIALLCVNSSPDERPTMKDVAAMLKEIKHEREEYAKVDVLLKGSQATADGQQNKKSGGVPATSSSRKALQSLYPQSNNTSFSGSSLFYSTSSKMSFK
ncbi:hypothetical protein C3L33_17449, partial [Rhododendron williamsianum]